MIIQANNVCPTITANTATPCKERLINLNSHHHGFIGQAAIATKQRLEIHNSLK